MTRNHIVHAATNLISVGLLTVFLLMFLALFFSCQSPASSAGNGGENVQALSHAPDSTTPAVHTSR
jgi:hypothetical protein